MVRNTLLAAILACHAGGIASAAETYPYAAALHLLPVPENKLTSCATFYPGMPLPVGIDGVTYVTMHIAADGTVSNASVFKSSGADQFDAAAVTCADALFIQPPTIDGAHVAVDWVGRVDWRRPPTHTYVAIALQDERLRVCLNYPPMAAKLGEQGSVVVSYDVMPDGNTGNIRVASSSGYDDLDAAAVACYSRYRFFPPTQGGKPLTITWNGVRRYQLGLPDDSAIQPSHETTSQSRH